MSAGPLTFKVVSREKVERIGVPNGGSYTKYRVVFLVQGSLTPHQNPDDDCVTLEHISEADFEIYKLGALFIFKHFTDTKIEAETSKGPRIPRIPPCPIEENGLPVCGNPKCAGEHE